MERNALVTGGNSGIGYATADLMKRSGYKVFISGRNPERVTEAARELGVEPLIADMASLADIKKLAGNFSESGLDVLVNNAAIARFAPLESYSENDFSEFFNTNIRGPMALIQQLLPALEKKQGCVTSVSSIATNNGLPNLSLYAATKGAVDAFTRSLALELAPRKIRVNAVSPGAIETPLLGKLGFSDEQMIGMKAQQEAMIPLGRLGKPEEVAGVILAQVESSYTTGSVWMVDGGVDSF